MRTKSFYALVWISKYKRYYYSEIHAELWADAKIYADHMWGEHAGTVYSSGGFWAYKKTHPELQELPKELANESL